MMSKHLFTAPNNVISVPFQHNRGPLPASCRLRSQCGCVFKVLFYAHLFLVYHYERVEYDTEREGGYRVEVYRVLAYFDEVAFAGSLLNLLAVFHHVFLGNRYYWSVTKLFHGS